MIKPMAELRRRHPWMSEAQIEIIRRAVLARAAERFERVAMWRDAAECWAELGQHKQAAALYARLGDWRAAAAASLDAGAFGAALAHYQAWTAQQAAEDVVAQVEGLLGQAACHLLPDLLELPTPGLDAGRGRALYLQARALTEAALAPLIAARCWAAVGAHGDRVERFDLVHEGYEMALRAYAEAGVTEERVQTLRRYLATVRLWSDQLLAADLEVRLAAETAEEGQPGWWAQRAVIEGHPFREGIHDVLHFTGQEQWAAWEALASMEEMPDVDDYLRRLAPPEMVYIPAGPFLMGSADDDAEADANEKPQHEVWLRGYYIDRYPVTNEVYRLFMEAGGYENEAYWTEAGWARKGQENWRQPRFWDDNQRNRLRQPVVGVSWYEAMAYSRWAGKALPAETQWEKAAGWDPENKVKRRYPWGEEWDERMANIYQPDSWPEVGQICAGNLNVYGVSDMAGLYTWCTTKWGSSYPYVPDDGREDEVGDAVRVSRGGGSDHYRKRCGFRSWNFPRDGDNGWGFRCVVPHACASSASGF